MSLKGIELQIAIPKTFEAGKIAEQKQQQSQLSQEQAQALSERDSLKSRETVLQSEKSSKTSADHRGGGQNDDQKKENHQHNEEEKKTVHPYKGSFVDFTG